jgi:hypothetical protein
VTSAAAQVPDVGHETPERLLASILDGADQVEPL